MGEGGGSGILVSGLCGRRDIGDGFSVGWGILVTDDVIVGGYCSYPMRTRSICTHSYY